MHLIIFFSMASTKDPLNNNPRISFPICIDHERQKLIPQYIHPTITSNINLYAPRNVLIDPKTGQEERFREKWSEKENIIFFEYLSANFYQWQFHKGEFYKWLSSNVFNKYTNKQIEKRWSQICISYNKIVKERQKGINKEWIYFDKVQEIMTRQKFFNKSENGDDDDENDNQEEDEDHREILGGRTSDEDDREIDSDSNDEYDKPTKDGELSDTRDKVYVRDPWTFEEKILLIDTIKEHIDEFLQDRIKFLKWISKNLLTKFHWKTIKNKLYMLSPNYASKKARLNKKNITEQDLELWSKIDEFFQFLKNKRNEMKTKSKKKYNYYKQRQKVAKNEKKKNPKPGLAPSTLKYYHKISYDDQKLLKYGHSLLKYTDEKNTDEMSEILGVTRWPEMLESLKVIPPKYVKMDIFEASEKKYSTRLEKAEQLIFKPNYSDDTFNLMIEYLSAPFKGGLTKSTDTFINQEVHEMVNSINKAHREDETDDVESGYENVFGENDQENHESDNDYNSNYIKKHDIQGRKRKIVVDNVNDVMDLGGEQEDDYEEDREGNRESQEKKRKRIADGMIENDIIDYENNYVHQNDSERSEDESKDRQESDEEMGDDISDNKLFCYKCGTVGHASKYCSIYSPKYFMNMRKQYSSVIVEFALRQLLDSIGFIFQNNIQNPTRLLEHTIEDDDKEHSLNKNNDLFQAETQGESSTSINHSGTNMEKIYPRTTNLAKPTREPTIKWDTVLRAAEMAGFDATVIKNTHVRISKYFDKEKQFEDFTSILKSSRNNVDSTDYLDGPDQLNIWCDKLK